MGKFKHLTQAILHNPPESYGDCQRTCLAMVLGQNPLDIPHFADPKLYALDASRAAEREWLRSQGYSYAQIPILGDWGLPWVMRQLVETAKDTPVIVSGVSPRGDWNHDIVVYQGQVYDPHPDRTGLAGPCIDTDKPEAARWFWLNIVSPLIS